MGARSFTMSVRPVVAAVVAGLLAVGLLSAAQSPAAAVDPAIDGTVTTSTGTGVGQVRVDAVANGAVVASTVTSDSGTYALDVADGTYSLTFTPAPGSPFSAVTAVWVDAPRNWPLDVVLTQPSVGRVFLTGDIALDTGEPITGGSVMFAGSGNRQGNDGYFSMTHAAGVTGGWMFSGTAQLPAGSLIVNATKGPTVTMRQDTNTQLTVPVTTTTVTARTATGTPVAGALVRLQVDGYGKPPGRVTVTGGTTPFTMGWTATARTNAAGVATLTRPAMVEPITGTLIVDPGDGRTQPVMSDALVPATGGELPATLSTPLATITGRVTTTDGNAVPGVQVIPRDPTSRVNGGTSTDANGAFRVQQPTGFTGDWMLSGRPTASEGPGSLVFTLTGGATRTWTSDGRMDFTVPRTTTRVRVTDATGAAVPGALVRVRVREGSGLPAAQVRLLAGEPPFSGAWNAAARTSAAGFADVPILQGVAPVPVTVTVDPPAGVDLLPRSLDLDSTALADTVVTLASPANARTTGRVTFSDGTPVVQAQVIPIDPAARMNGGNSADADGAYTVVKPTGFIGVWNVTARPQANLTVRDPLWFTLKGSSPRTWTGNFTQDFTIPKTLYRVRVVDPAGTPVTHARVSVRVDDTPPNPAAQVPVLAGEAPWVGTWAGWDYTGTDGIAQVPGVVMDNTVMTVVDVTTDPVSRLLPRTLALRSSALSETVIVLQTLPMTVDAMSPTTAAPGDTITITGSGFAADATGFFWSARSIPTTPGAKPRSLPASAA